MNRPPLPARLAFALFALAAAGHAFAGPPQGAPDRPRAQAANTPPPPAWEQLTPAQREAIVAVLRDRWNDNPHERARMLQHAERWKRQLSPEERAALREKLKTMTPDQRRAWMREQRELRQRRAPGDVPGRTAPDAPAPDRRP